MKVLIYQVYVPTDGKGCPKDLPNPDIVNDSVRSFTEYSEKYEIDYLFENKATFTPDELPSDCDGRMRFYWAMALCREDLMAYDYIIHVDADIVAQPHAKDIRQIIKGDFMACRDLMDYQGQWYKPLQMLRRAWAYQETASTLNFSPFLYFNSGVWISSKKARRLVRDNWQANAFKKWSDPVPESFPFKVGNPYGGDQNILNGIVHNSDLEFQPLTWNWNALSNGLRSVKEADFIHFGARPGKVLWHHQELLGQGQIKMPQIKELEKQLNQKSHG